MNVRDYEYFELDDFAEISQSMQENLVNKMKNYIRKGSIQLNKLLKISENNIELDFMYTWLYENNIQINGMNGTLSGEIGNYNYIKRLKDTTKEIQKKEVLSKEEVKEYFKKIRAGDINAKNEFIEKNMSLANWYVHAKVPYKKQVELGCEDIEQIAMIGIINAVEKFDYKKDYTFSTYAASCMRNEIQKALIDHIKAYKIPADLVKKINKLEKIEVELEKQLGKIPTQKIAEKMKISINEVKKLQKIRSEQNLMSIEQLQEEKIKEENLINSLKDTDRAENIEGGIIVDGVYIYEQEEDKNNEIITTQDNTPINTELEAEAYVMPNEIHKALNTLIIREREVLEKRFGIGDGEKKTQKELAKQYKMGIEKMRGIEAKGLRKLRNPSRRNNLKCFYGNTSYQYENKNILENKKSLEKREKLENEIQDLLQYRTKLDKDIEWIAAKDIEY